ncbi:Unknown protein sequence [Pseudomonas syringae pv. spinaceae]|uniref:Uncharacterized protein n=1 Tax=Pseudomonas syringae pv. spinaceae TaxID=264459 RepID=A0A0Q0CFR5_PSESX|nr:Unknown protein sequence [Pseudomonas syringae pv. spinaceae]
MGIFTVLLIIANMHATKLVLENPARIFKGIAAWP